MKSLNQSWKIDARQAEREDIIDMPVDSFADREGNSQEPLLNDDIQLYYLPEESEALTKLHKLTETSGCLKQPTRAMIIRNGEILGVGANAGKKFDHCSRVEHGCKTGEGYHYCRDSQGCNQIEHAEIMAIHDAVQNIDPEKGNELMEYIKKVNNAVAENIEKSELSKLYTQRNKFIRKEIQPLLDPEEEGLDLVMDGHWWACQSCTSAMIDTGITSLYLREKASELYNPLLPNNILPKFNKDGRVKK